jgi:regulator of replication initiation timing
MKDSIYFLMEMGTHINNVVEECIQLRKENKRLKQVEKEYDEFLKKVVDDTNKNIGITIKAMLKEI